MSKDPLMDEFKLLENQYDLRVMPKMPFIVRLDGKAFHSFVKKANYERPFSKEFSERMTSLLRELTSEFHAVLGFTQSDELSLLFLQDRTEHTQAIFGGRINKINSVLASHAGCWFNFDHLTMGIFDARTFSIPKDRIQAYFRARQRDCYRNWVNSWAQFYLGHSAIEGLTVPDRLKLIEAKGINLFTEETLWQRRGIFSFRSNKEVTSISNGPIIGTEPCDFITEIINDYYKDEE